ncbi:hypothetical protein KY290_021912 [Solanum tuberosum]|uniref:RNase H type-1 domain-containing protein n=1 Tax=Solanum tuberosum TaxID=4113 RepID=A0ABQ7V2Z3_SOLTU|nr:hypothetical protein KY289_021074 [Solanum tuberosum]KAH0758419.1 hypothetical protein KY290_021912 [Solanum tuberosum]
MPKKKSKVTFKPTDHSLLLIEATSSILHLASIKFEHCYREANQLADGLTKMAMNSQTRNIYLSAQQLPQAAK